MKGKEFNKKTIVLLLAPLLVALMVVGIIFSVRFNKQSNEKAETFVENVDYTYNKVYLVDNDNVLVPLTIKYETFDSVGEELMYLVSCLKENSEITNNHFKGLLNENVSVTSMNLDEGSLNISFNESFSEYDKEKELRIVESLIWTFTDLDYVDNVTLSINENVLTNMPLKNTPLNEKMDKHFGVNNFVLTSSIFQTGEMVLSYYEKVIDEKYYYVPVTHYVSNNNDLSIYDLTVQTLFKDPGITSELEVCRVFKDTSMVTSSILTDNVLYLSLTEDILFDEVTVSLDVYNILKEVSVLFDDVKDVSFLMDLQEVMVNGVEEDEEVKVSKIELNKFYI